MSLSIVPTPLQKRILGIPAGYSIIMAGGRASGKTYSLGLLALRHLAEFGQDAKILLVRESYKALSQIEELFVAMLNEAFPGRVKFNKQEHIARIDGGGTFEWGQLESAADVRKYLGRECTLLIFEEMGLLKESKWVTLLKSNLRSPRAGMELRTIATCNPGGRLHGFIFRNYIAKRIPWVPYEVEGETFVTVPSTLLDNPHIDQDDYRKRIRAACVGDPALAAAWEFNDWSLQAGAFFNEWDASVHLLPEKLPFLIDRRWAPALAYDHGVSAPTVCLFAGTAPDGIYGIPRGSTVVFDEVTTADMSDEGLNTSLGWPLSKIAENILERCAFWQIHAQGVADDAYGYLGSPGDSLLAEFRNSYNIGFTKPQKARSASLALIKSKLSNAVLKNGKPGLYMSERCHYLVATLPIIQTDARKRDDIDTAGPDHAVDALRYHLTSAMPVIKIRTTTGY